MNSKKANCIMRKKLYVTPRSEVMQMGSECVLKYTGPASVPSQDFAPKRRTEVF